MTILLDWAEKNGSVILEAYHAKNTKTRLKYIIQDLAKIEQEEEDLRIYGKKNPKMEDIRAKINERYEDEGKFWDPIVKDYIKK